MTDILTAVIFILWVIPIMPICWLSSRFGGIWNKIIDVHAWLYFALVPKFLRIHIWLGL